MPKFVKLPHSTPCLVAETFPAQSVERASLRKAGACWNFGSLSFGQAKANSSLQISAPRSWRPLYKILSPLVLESQKVIYAFVVFVFKVMFSLANLALPKNRITNNLSRFATRGSFGLRWVLCLWCNAVAFVLRCSLLNWALALGWHQRSKVLVFIGFFS